MTALPTRKLEAWRYTDLKGLAGVSFVETPALPVTVDLPELGIPRVVFVNGVLDAALSTLAAYGAGFAAVAEASAMPLALINAEQARDGLTLNVPAGVDAGALLLVSYAEAQAPAAVHPRHRVTLGAGARLTIIDVSMGQGLYWHNPVTDIALHEGAVLSHYRLQDESAEAYHTATIRAKIASGAAYESFTAVLGAKLSRAEFHVNLLGPKASTHINAAQLLGGHQHGDFTTIIAHDAPDCASRQTVRSVLSDHARGVFQGRIEVARVAQKTDGYQMNQALLLSDTAEMDIKPELEIFADDVKCSHGATIGALDEEQVFYLRSRGIPEAQARAILIRAFLDEALAPVTHEAARVLLDRAIETWWARK
jgi:Fe-S cluster assembly protein SufD